MEPLTVLLRAHPFQDVPPAELEPLLPAFKRHSFRRGDVVWNAGDLADELWFVLSGAVHTVHTSEDGAEVVTMVNAAGEAFGDIGMFLPDHRRRMRCLAGEASELMSLSRAPLLRFLEGHPAALSRMLEKLSISAAQMTMPFVELALRDVRSRLAWRLLELSTRAGEEVEGGILIRAQLTQSVLAGMLGASREKVNRALAGFVAAGDIRLESGRVVVLRPDALRAAVGADQGIQV